MVVPTATVGVTFRLAISFKEIPSKSKGNEYNDGKTWPQRLFVAYTLIDSPQPPNRRNEAKHNQNRKEEAILEQRVIDES